LVTVRLGGVDQAERFAEDGDHFIDGVETDGRLAALQFGDEARADAGQFAQLALAQRAGFSPRADELSYLFSNVFGHDFLD
jgi:hypothetical protein